MVKSPVLFIIFNRPDVTQKVFSQIRNAKPSQLYVAADGPRKEKSGEQERCEETRKITEQVDWPCTVKRLYRKENLGCKIAVSSAIDWFFENEEEGTILEDDCLPSGSFFEFCDEMLERYREDERIMMVSGTNLEERWKDKFQDYHFSRMGGIWGWASWKRAWKYYDVNMKLFGNNRTKELLKSVFKNSDQYIERMILFNQVYNNRIDTWDYQWNFARLINNGLSVVPSKNLVTNIGFGNDATHTKIKSSEAGLMTHEIHFPLKENKYIMPDSDYDKIFFHDKNKCIATNFFRQYFDKMKGIILNK